MGIELREFTKVRRGRAILSRDREDNTFASSYKRGVCGKTGIFCQPESSKKKEGSISFRVCTKVLNYS